MPSYSGQDTVIQVGGTGIGELKNSNWSITADELDTTTFGVAGKNKTRTASLRECALDFAGFLDPEDAGQAALLTALFAASAIGVIPALTMYPFGVTAGTSLAGPWLVTNAGISSTHDGMVEVNFSLKSNGEIVYTA